MIIYTQILTVIFLILHFSIINSNLYEVDYHQFFSHNNIKIYSGTPLCEYSLSMDLTSELTWFFVEPSTVSTTLRDTHESVVVYYNSRSGKGVISHDTFAFTNGTDAELFSLKFILISNRELLPIYEAEGVIGLAFHYSNKEYSLLHQLKEFNIIKQLSFSIHQGNHKVVFGGIPERYTKDRDYSYCNVLGVNGNWNCLISSVIVHSGNKTIDYFPLSKNIVTFTTENHANYAPKAFFQLLVDDLFKDKINEKIYRLLGDDKRIYTSSENEIMDGDIIITIGDYSYNLSIASFWDCYEEGCDFELNKNDKDDDWILGSSFTGRFNTHFNIEERKIHFYSHKRLRANKVNNGRDNTVINNDGEFFVYIINIIVSLAGLGMSILVRMRLNKRV